MINLGSQSGSGGGSLVALSPEIILPQIYGHYGGTNTYYLNQLGSGTHILNSGTDGAYAIGKVPEKFHGKTITKAYIYLTAVDAAGDIDLTIGKTFDASGDPSTVADTVTVNFASIGGARIVQVAFATGMAVSRGETLFLGILPDTAQVRVLYSNRNISELIETRSWVNTTGPYIDGSLVPIVAFECSDGTVGCLDGAPWCLHGNTTTTYTQNQGMANRFTALRDCRVSGIWNAQNSLTGAADGAADWLLLNSLGATLASKSVPSKLIGYPANRNGIIRQYFSAPVDLAAGDVFYTGIMHTAATGDFRPYTYNLCNEIAHEDVIWKTVPGHDEWAVQAYVFDAGSLVDAATKFNMHAIGPIITHL